jgi:transcription initiation factor TFIID subunit 8
MYQPTHSEITSTLYNPYLSNPQQYNATAGFPPIPYYPSFSHSNQLRSSPVPDIPPPPPDLTSITPEIASRVIRRLVVSECRDAGFDSAQLPAVKRIEIELIACTFDLPAFEV